MTSKWAEDDKKKRLKQFADYWKSIAEYMSMGGQNYKDKEEQQNKDESFAVDIEIPDTKDLVKQLENHAAAALKAEHFEINQKEEEDEKKGKAKKKERQKPRAGIICCCGAEGCRIGPMVERAA